MEKFKFKGIHIDKKLVIVGEIIVGNWCGLNGVWHGDDQSTYFIRDIDNEVWWFGANCYLAWNNIVWTNVARGNLHGALIDLDWADVPYGKILGGGKLTLRLIDRNHLTATDKHGASFGTSKWERETFNPILRWYNSKDGDHFFASPLENLGIIYGERILEGNPYLYLASANYPGTEALYRFWNSKMKNHFCSTDSNAEGAKGWKYEGILGYIPYLQLPGTVPLYRFWNNKNGDHLYSFDPNAEGAKNYVPEGITGYVWVG